MLVIYVDADSCAVKDEVLKVASRHDLEAFMVSNQYIRQNMGPKVHKILVAANFDEADNWIEEHINIGDIAITADILLASRCIKKKAIVINPNGKIFDDNNINMKVAMRDLNTHLRETGEISSYNASFSKQDRSRFLETLENTIQKLKRL
ncbi:hypothetical protein SZ25_00086 [Candidatus Arcanobacter lacustris]|uniref:UPF0178 protein SZ25_00086 n=1 Tax=Candidatus Arcanibacter lacustris TaxID=1607817 RepID=A0A0F5MRY5_9RICK|nr:hypothetical protein SZ25_00086 [Candidatus Arcanobacter lacustris]